MLERGSDMVLAAHRTPVSRRLVATTMETVRFTRPERRWEQTVAETFQAVRTEAERRAGHRR